jgi:hypothetical protein
MPSAKAQTLAALEELEADQINCGCYVTRVSFKDLCDRLQQPGDSSASKISDETIQQTLKQLIEDKEIIEWQLGFYRSRIAETVRVLRLLRQRFWWQRSLVESPLLIEDIRVEFRQRRRPDRSAVQVEQAIPAEVPPTITQQFLQAIQIPSFSKFQQRAIQEIFACSQRQNSNNESFIIAGDTGAGKTEAFLFPILLDIASEPSEERQRAGVRAVLVYPRIRLARNQLARLLRYTSSLKKVGGPSLTIAIQNGDTPRNSQAIKEKWSDPEQPGRYRVALLESCINFVNRSKCEGQYWLAEGELQKDRPLLICDHCGHSIDSLYLTQEALAKHAPDLLIITDVSLSQWMARERYTHLWGLWEGEVQTVPPRYLVLDEVHLYEQIKGAHIARLIKRFQARVRLVYKATQQFDRHPIIIGVSATLNDEQAFLAKLLDVKRSNEELYQKLRVIKPKDKNKDKDEDDELEDTEGRERYIFICPRRLSPTPGNPEYRVNDQTAAIQIVMAVMHNLKREVEWRGLAFFDSINDLRQFSSNYDATSNGANQQQLWRIRTDAANPTNKKQKLHHNCGGVSCLERLNQHSLNNCSHFQAGDCWLFSQLEGWNRQLEVANSVYAGSSSQLDGKDLIPTSPSLEVGYDDDAIQLVYQHKAPPNAASFIQRRGRAGRNPNDSPIIITMLWPHRSGDMFYYYHPDALYAPSFDDAPLNANNFNVQRTHVLLAFFDLLACLRRQNLNNLRNDPAIVDFTQAGNEFFLLSDQVVQSRSKLSDPKRPGQERLVIKHRQTHQSIWFSGGQLRYIQESASALQVQGWLAMDRGLTFQVLRRSWEALKTDELFENYLNAATVASLTFKQHSTYPYRIRQGGSLPIDLLNQFGHRDWHSSHDKLERSNWLKTYRHIDWMLQGKEDATTLIVHYPNDQTPNDTDEDKSNESTFDLTFALTELLPGNVSYRLREDKWIHWTPIPKEGESTFLYPEEDEIDAEGNITGRRIIPQYEPELSDITSQPESIFGVPHYLDTNFPGLQFMRLRRLRVEQFSRPSEQSSSTWYFDVDEDCAVRVEAGQAPPPNAVQIARRTGTRPKSVVIPYIASNRNVERRNLETPLDSLFSTIEGYITEGTAMLGYTRAFYEMQIDLKTIDKEPKQLLKDAGKETLLRHFYPPHPQKDAEGHPLPILVGYSMETHGIAFYINPELLAQVIQRVLNDEDLRLSLRRRMALYHLASYATEKNLYMKNVIDIAEVVIDYWLHEVVPASKGQPRLPSRIIDLVHLEKYYRTHRNVQDAEVRVFNQMLTEEFFERINEVLEKAFKTTQELYDFVESTILHSLSALLKALIARLGGVSSDDLIAYADMPILDLVDRSINPRILILDKVEGGSGAIAQAFERLELSSNNQESEASLWWVLQRDLGQCPIANGEAIMRTVLSQASEDQIRAAQDKPTPESLEDFLNQLHLHSPSETRQILGRTLFSDLTIGIYGINPALILKELIELHSQLNVQIPGRYPKEAVVCRAVQTLDSHPRPHIQRLRDALATNGVAQNELKRELAIQLMAIYSNSCEDGCPVCMSEGSDVEHYLLAPLLRSRRVLNKLREQLLAQLPQSDCLADLADLLKGGQPVEVQSNSSQLDNRLNPNLGLAVVQKVDETGQLAGSIAIPLNEGKTISEVLTTQKGWKERWDSNEHKPYHLRDDHWVRSRGEFIIATKLAHEGINFDLEMHIPYTQNGQTRRIHPDFYLYDYNLYLEYWGRDDSAYIESRRLKEEVYQKRGIQPINIEDDELQDDRFMIKIWEALESQ